MRLFYVVYPPERIWQTLSAKSEELKKPEPPLLALAELAADPKLQAPFNENARRFYETEALRGGWSVRQIDRQIK
jgi:hypothetical protein